MDVLGKELYALKFNKILTKSEKNIKIFILLYLIIRMERNARITSILVY